ncbi:MAG: hypothetical protein V7L04_17880 [Nostoc sp.]|nr:hypothetical protein [Nostoc sp. S13]MDF5736095.1 hypothetical protein [Nostoc sp. S13]
MKRRELIRHLEENIYLFLREGGRYTIYYTMSLRSQQSEMKRSQ